MYLPCKWKFHIDSIILGHGSSAQLKKILLSWRLCLLSELFGLQQDPFLTHSIFIVLIKGQLTRHWGLGVFLHFEHAQSGDFGQSVG